MRSGSAGMGAWLLPCATSAAEVRQPAAMSNRIACVNVHGWAGPSPPRSASGRGRHRLRARHRDHGGVAGRDRPSSARACRGRPRRSARRGHRRSGEPGGHRLAPPCAGPLGQRRVRICDAASARVPSGPPAEESCTGGVGYRVPLTGMLPAGAACPIAFGAGNEDASGAALPPGWSGSSIRPRGRHRAARASEVSVAAAGPCLAVRFSTDEPAAGVVTETAAGMRSRAEPEWDKPRPIRPSLWPDCRLPPRRPWW